MPGPLKILATSMHCTKFQIKVFLYHSLSCKPSSSEQWEGDLPPSFIPAVAPHISLQIKVLLHSKTTRETDGMTDDQPKLFSLRKAFHKVKIINSKTNDNKFKNKDKINVQTHDNTT